jgi:hypothetical protein
MKKKLTIAFTIGALAGGVTVAIIVFQDEVLSELFKEAKG